MSVNRGTAAACIAGPLSPHVRFHGAAFYDSGRLGISFRTCQSARIIWSSRPVLFQKLNREITRQLDDRIGGGRPVAAAFDSAVRKCGFARWDNKGVTKALVITLQVVMRNVLLQGALQH